MKRTSPYPFESLHPDIQRLSHKGAYCPQCGHYVRQYRRSLNSNMARFLIKLYHAQSRYDRWYTTRELYPRDNKASTDGIMTRFWGLLEVQEAVNQAGAPVGSFKLTDAGRRFVLNSTYVMQYACIYNGECIGIEGKYVRIQDVLKKKFNYDELMSGL